MLHGASHAEAASTRGPIAFNTIPIRFSYENRNVQELMMGVETPIPPIAMNARRPEGRPAAGIITVETVITDFHGFGASTLLMHVSTEQFFNRNN